MSIPSKAIRIRGWKAIATSAFASWVALVFLGCDSGTTGPGTDTDMAINQVMHQLSVTVLPDVGGTVTADGVDINCGSGNTMCTATIIEGAVIKLLATPAATYKFDNWSGRGCVGSAAMNNVMLNEDTSCIASFSK